MLDPKLIRQHYEQVKTNLIHRGESESVLKKYKYTKNPLGSNGSDDV